MSQSDTRWWTPRRLAAFAIWSALFYAMGKGAGYSEAERVWMRANAQATKWAAATAGGR